MEGSVCAVPKNDIFQGDITDFTTEELGDIIDETFDVIDDVILKRPEHASAVREVGKRVLEYVLHVNEKKIKDLQNENEAIDNLLELADEMKEEETVVEKETNNLYS